VRASGISRVQVRARGGGAAGGILLAAAAGAGLALAHIQAAASLRVWPVTALAIIVGWSTAASP
jgi:hypothetical protein